METAPHKIDNIENGWMRDDERVWRALHHTASTADDIAAAEMMKDNGQSIALMFVACDARLHDDRLGNMLSNNLIFSFLNDISNERFSINYHA